MIRRFYILPLRHGVTQAQIDQMLTVLCSADHFIPGLVDSAAGLDSASGVVVWENSFVDAETYSGSYMVHPYHGFSLDGFLMADSPECLTHDIYTTRYELPGAVPRLERGIRRLLLMNVAEGSDMSAIEALARPSADVATSVLCRDNVQWVSGKGRPWTHVWEQGFDDVAALDRYLATREGIASASVEGLKRLDIEVEALRTFTYPVALHRPAAPPPEGATDAGPVFYEIVARLDPENVADYVTLLADRYDRYVADAGGELVDRVRTVTGGSIDVVVRSTWQLASMAAYSDVRLKTATDPNWSIFVRDAMPLVRGGTRRFYAPL